VVRKIWNEVAASSQSNGSLLEAIASGVAAETFLISQDPASNVPQTFSSNVTLTTSPWMVIAV